MCCFRRSQAEFQWCCTHFWAIYYNRLDKMDFDCFAGVCSLLLSVRETQGSKITIPWWSEIKIWFRISVVCSFNLLTLGYPSIQGWLWRLLDWNCNSELKSNIFGAKIQTLRWHYRLCKIDAHLPEVCLHSISAWDIEDVSTFFTFWHICHTAGVRNHTGFKALKVCS